MPNDLTITLAVVAVAANFLIFLANLWSAHSARQQVKLARAEREEAERLVAAAEGSAEAARRSADAAERSNEREERREEREKQQQAETAVANTKAKLRVVAERGDSMISFVVVNEGKAAAEEVELIVDGKPFNEHQAVCHEFPTSADATVLPGGQLTGQVVAVRGCSIRSPAQATLKWSDESGLPGNWKSQLQF